MECSPELPGGELAKAFTMKFSEIKHKIKNLGNFKSLKEIKKAGLRVVRNTKTGDYWLIEKEFLKPVIKSPRECRSILIRPKDLKYRIFMCHKSRKELRGTKALEYIKWGESQNFHTRPTCKGRQTWWILGKRRIPNLIAPAGFNNTYRIFLNSSGVYADKRLYECYYSKPYQLTISLNSSIFPLMMELESRTGLGEGLLDITVYELQNTLVVTPTHIRNAISVNFERKICDIYEEFGFDCKKPIRQQQLNPLPDRKALDDIVFDVLGLTEEEQKEVYWAVAELVKNRLEKAKSV